MSHRRHRHPRKPQHFERWLQFAENDLAVARHLLQDSPFFYEVCFHAQQAAEKALKSYLYFHKTTIELRFHSLPRLVKLIRKRHDPSAKDLWRDAIILNRYYASTRYPDSYIHEHPQGLFTEKEAVESIEIAERIINWVKEKININN